MAETLRFPPGIPHQSKIGSEEPIFASFPPGEAFGCAIRRGAFIDIFLIDTKFPIYNCWQMLYDNREQSKMFRVKCRRDGELCGGRRFDRICDGRSAPAVAYWW